MNEVTKKQVISIDLRKAVNIVDVNAVAEGVAGSGKPGDPPKSSAMRPRDSDEGFSVRPRSMRVEFGDGDQILFSTDTDEEKTDWWASSFLVVASQSSSQWRSDDGRTKLTL